MTKITVTAGDVNKQAESVFVVAFIFFIIGILNLWVGGWKCYLLGALMVIFSVRAFALSHKLSMKAVQAVNDAALNG